MRVLVILMPVQRVGQNVVAYRLEVILVANDVFVIIALPDGGAWRATMFVNTLGDGGFVSPDERR